MEPGTVIRFDGWTLFAQSGELLKDGVRIRLQTQPLQVLLALLESPGDMVTREQLIARLWPKGIVDFDTALNSAIRRLRTALGDHATAPRYIETIPRRGYRFIGHVDAPGDEPAEVDAIATPSVVPVPQSRSRGWRWSAIAAALIAFVTLHFAMPDRAAEPRVGDAGPASPDPRAQELYERARYLSYRRGNGDLELARRYFHQSVTFDPNFAQAWAGLAGVYWIETVEARLPEQQGLAQLRAAAERALALDPGLAEAHLRLANYHWRAGDRAAGDGHLRRAVALEPDNALVLSFVASISAGDGRLDEAIAQMRRAVEVEPLASLYRYNLASYLYLAGHGEEALAELDKLLELAPASRDRDMDLVGLALILAGRFDEALLVSADLQDESSRLQVRALALYGSGRAAEADAALESLAWAAREQGAYRVAEVYAYRGETDRAFTWLQRANDESGSRRSSTRKPQPLAVEYSPLLKPLHTDPRWRAWLDS